MVTTTMVSPRRSTTCEWLIRDMNTTNPYESPKASKGVSGDTIARPKRLPVWWSGGLLFIGVCNLLLLDGQFFTNTFVFLGFLTLSAIVWLPVLIRSKEGSRRRIALYVLFSHALLVVLFATGLPECYRRQQKFNEMRNQLRQSVDSQDAPTQCE